MARTKIVPTEGLLSDLEYTSVIVSYSNGIDSTGALYWAVKNFPKEKIYLLYCDTGCEYPENVALFYKVAAFMGVKPVLLSDRLERKYGADMFKQIFKTITVDNGSEFADVNGLERSILEEGEKRTHLYYCHPYSSWERGTNEVTNKMVRRKVPKGTNFDDKTDEEIEKIEGWINGYPRRIHGYRSAGELFTEELEKLA